MALEVATFISQLVSSNPAAGDSKSQGDDHLRLIKAALQATFPGVQQAIYFPSTGFKTVSGTINSTTETNNVTLVDTSGGAVTLTLPNTLTGVDFWQITILKYTTDTNPVFVAPPSGSIDGFAKIRLNVPGEAVTFVWFGTFFSRLLSVGATPAGTHLEFGGATVPVGYLAEEGQSLVAADYPELFGAFGYLYGGVGANFNLPISAGTALVARDAAPLRIDTTNFGITPATVGNVGGSQTHTLVTGELPSHTHPIADLTDPGHTHTGGGLFDAFATLNTLQSGGAQSAANVINSSGTASTDSNTTGITVADNTGATGSGNVHKNIQPSMISNRILRAC